MLLLSVLEKQMHHKTKVFVWLLLRYSRIDLTQKNMLPIRKITIQDNHNCVLYQGQVEENHAASFLRLFFQYEVLEPPTYSENAGCTAVFPPFFLHEHFYHSIFGKSAMERFFIMLLLHIPIGRISSKEKSLFVCIERKNLTNQT